MKMVEVMLANTPGDSLALARQIAAGSNDPNDVFAALITLVRDLEAVTAIGKKGSLTTWLEQFRADSSTH